MSADLTLYALTDGLPALLDSLEMTEPGSPERAECEAEIATYMTALPKKVDAVAHVLAHAKSQVALGTEEIHRIQGRIARLNGIIKRLDGYVTAVLETLPEPKRGPRRLEGATATLALRQNPPKLFINDATKIPAEYLVIVPQSVEVCNSAVKDALKLKIDVPGAELRVGYRVEVC